MPSTSELPAWLILPGFLAIWLLASLAISRISGWAALASSFQLEADFNGDKWNWQSATMRWGTRLNHCLAIGCDQRGLYLAMMLPFRFCHPPLLIPWREIQVSRRRYFLFEYVQLLLGREERIPLLLFPRTAERLRLAARDRWPGSVN